MSQAITLLHQHSTRPLRNSSRSDGTSKGTALSQNRIAARIAGDKSPSLPAARICSATFSSEQSAFQLHQQRAERLTHIWALRR